MFSQFSKDIVSIITKTNDIYYAIVQYMLHTLDKQSLPYIVKTTPAITKTPHPTKNTLSTRFYHLPSSPKLLIALLENSPYVNLTKHKINSECDEEGKYISSLSPGSILRKDWAKKILSYGRMETSYFTISHCVRDDVVVGKYLHYLSPGLTFSLLHNMGCTILENYYPTLPSTADDWLSYVILYYISPLHSMVNTHLHDPLDNMC